MTITDMVNSGYRFYRARVPVQVDCVSMRTLEMYLWHLGELLGEHSPQHGSPGFKADEVNHEWERIAQWLRMAAGLSYVDVDMAYGDGPSFMCGRAAEYDDAASDLASRWATEQTRLHYVWNAVERLLTTMELPAVTDAPGRFNGATLLLKDNWAGRRELPHYKCVARHLREHVERDPSMISNSRLAKAFEESPWRGDSGVLLAAGNQMRHPTAHGDLMVPMPETWGDGDPGEPGVQLQLHAPRLAARGLGLSIQMLLISAEASFIAEGIRAPYEGWWVQNRAGQWERRDDADPRDLFFQAHLDPPDDDDEDSEFAEEDSLP